MPALVFHQTWNGFEIDPSEDNNQIKFQTTLFDVLAINNVSFTPLYKGVES